MTTTNSHSALGVSSSGSSVPETRWVQKLEQGRAVSCISTRSHSGRWCKAKVRHCEAPVTSPGELVRCDPGSHGATAGLGPGARAAACGPTAGRKRSLRTVHLSPRDLRVHDPNVAA